MSAAVIALALLTLGASIVLGAAILLDPKRDGPGWAILSRAVVVWFVLMAATLLLGLVALIADGVQQ